MNSTIRPKASPLFAIVGLGGIQVLSMVAGILRAKVIAVVVGVAGFGLISVIDYAVALVAQLASLSIPMAATRFLPTRREESADAFAALYHALSFVLVAFSVVATLVAGAVAVWRPETFGQDVAGLRTVTLLALLGVPAAAYAPFLRSVMAIVGKHTQAAFSVFLSGVALVVSSYVGLRLGGLEGLYLGNLVVGLPTVALLHGYLRPSLPKYTGARVRLMEVLRREDGLATFCTVMHVLTLASPLAYFYVRLRVLTVLGKEAAGLMAAAYAIAIAVRVVLNQGNALYLAPLVNQPTTKPTRSEATADYLHVMTILMVIGGSTVLLFPEPWVRALYSPGFTAAAPFVGLFLVGEAIMLSASVLQALLIGFGDIRAHLTNTAIGQTLVLAGAFSLVPRSGIAGAAIAIIVGHTMILGLTAARLVVRHEASAVARALPFLGFGLATLGAGAWWSASFTPALAWRGLALVGVAVSFASRLKRDEREMLSALWRRLGSR